MKTDYLYSAEFRFYEELNDFLHPRKRKKALIHRFLGHPALKEVIEGMGIPHTEIDLIIVNGQSVDFEYHLKEGDRIAVYPQFESIDISPIISLRPKPLRQTAFIADVHLAHISRVAELYLCFYSESILIKMCVIC